MIGKMEKYLAALEVAVEAKDKKAIELLEPFSAYVYHEIYAKEADASGEEQVAWNGMLQRVKVLIAKMAPQIW